MKQALTTMIVVAALSVAPAYTTPLGSEVDLSPASWGPGELQKYDELLQKTRRAHPRGAGRRGVVVGTTGAPAVRAGLEALKQGGSAADAAIVTALTQVTLAAGCWVSFAGKWVMVYYEAETGQVHALDGGFNTVTRESDPLSIPPFGEPSGRTALVPGFMAGIKATHERFGKLPWASLFEPAIYYAEEGFEIYPLLGNLIRYRGDVLTRLPEAQAIFTHPEEDRLYKTHDPFRQPQLAATLRRVAERGARDMYSGRWARRFVQAVRAEGGNVTMADMRAYEPLWTEPERGFYRGYEIVGPGAPGTGGTAALETLARLEPHDLAGLGHFSESADAFYELLSATRTYRLNRAAVGHHSDGVIAIDKEGNVAAVVHTINTDAWGTTGIFVDGISIPDIGAWAQNLIAQAGPGGRLSAPTNPLIVLRDGEPFLASSAIGSGLFEATVQGLVNVLDYGLDPKAAVHKPFFRNPGVREPSDPSEVTRGEFSTSLVESVRERGIPVNMPLGAQATGHGHWIDAMIYRSGRRMGATTNDFNGHALGY